MIKEGDTFPEKPEVFTTWDWKTNKPVEISNKHVFDGKRVVLVAFPGAYTTVCHNAHGPKFVQQFDQLKQLGFDNIVFTAVNDVWVGKYWLETIGGGDGKIIWLADGNGELAKELGILKDFSARGMGMRSARYAMIVDNRRILYFGEDGEQIQKSSVDSVINTWKSMKAEGKV